MRKSAWAFVVGFVIIAAAGASAKTPDGVTPSRETVCDLEQGAAYGLCTAYCEAMDCTDPNQHASDQGCESVRKNYEKKTGRMLPCLVQCPCFAQLQLFQQIVNGQTVVERCVVSDDMLFVIVPGGDFALVDSMNANCNVNGEPPLVPLDPTEAQVCRVRLRQIVESTGVICTPPE